MTFMTLSFSPFMTSMTVSLRTVMTSTTVSGYLEGSGAHVLVLAPVSAGGCGVNHIGKCLVDNDDDNRNDNDDDDDEGGTHEMLHILGLAHVQNRADRCNYIDVNTELLQASGGRITGPKS